MYTHKKYLATLAIVAAVGFPVGAGLAACSSSGSSGPPTATSVLQNDGYTPSAAYTQALQSGIGGGNGEVLTSQAGTNNNGQIQLVIVFDNSADASAGVSGVNQTYGTTGITTVSNGQVLTATGTVQDFANAGG